MADFKDYYQVLGVPKNADEKQIKQAYRKLARKLHPDVNQNNKEATEKFKTVNEAWEVLGDADKRKSYDALGRQGTEGTSRRAKPARNEWGSIFPEGWWINANEWYKTPYAKPNPAVDYGKTKKRKKPEPQEAREQEIPVIDENISLPVNDLGLLRALILANQTKDDNLWHTRRSIADTRVSKERDHIPLSDLVYEVRKENGVITVSRTVDDWRIRRHRDKRITHIRSGETFDAGAFIPETRLFNQELDISNVRIPNNFVAYLRDLKSLAKKMAEGGDWQNNAREETERIAGFRKDYESRLESLRDPLRTVPLVDLKRRAEEEIVLRDIVGFTEEGNQRIKFGFEGKV